jgi:hypothetical protein
MKEDSLFLRLNGTVLLQQVNQPRQTIDSGLNMRGSDIDTALGQTAYADWRSGRWIRHTRLLL